VRDMQGAWQVLAHWAGNAEAVLDIFDAEIEVDWSGPAVHMSDIGDLRRSLEISYQIHAG
jgi:hypothetical protein